MYDLSQFNNTKFEDLAEFVQYAINFATSIAALIAVIFLVYAGFLYITSGGEGEKAEKAQKTIIYALIGLVLAFLAPLLISFILNTFIGVEA